MRWNSGFRTSIFLLVAIAWLATSGIAPAPAGEAPARDVREPGAGLLFYEAYDWRDNTDAVNNPHIIGAFFQLYWSEIEKEKGVYDWSEWDRRIEPWITAGKKIALRFMFVSSGNWPLPAASRPTPQWVWDEGAKHATYEKVYAELPLFWDPIYRKYKNAFMEEVARKFDNDPNVLFIDVTPGAETNPYRFRVYNLWTPEFREEYAALPASDGRAYNDEMWLETVKEHIDDAAAIFQRTPLLVTLNNAGMRGDRIYEVGQHCVAKGFIVGQNGLSPGRYNNDTQRRRAFAAWDARVKLFFEMVDATGEDLHTLLRRWGRPPLNEPEPAPDASTLMEYILTAQTMHCSYLNVYGDDVLKGTKGHPTYDPAWEEALKYGAEVLGKPGTIPSGDDEVLGQKVFSYEQTADLRNLEQLLNDSKDNKGRGGRYVHYFQADTDGSIQPVGVFAPEDYDAASQYPLVVQLHGTGPKYIAGVRASWPGMRDEEWIDPELDVICIQPYARQNAVYQGIAEAEVMQTIRIARENYNIDPQRIYIMGHSMGGNGTINLALHHPSLFAAFVPIDAGVGENRRTQGPDWAQITTGTYDPLNYPDNAALMRLRMHVADTPRRMDQIDVFNKLMVTGCTDLGWIFHPGMPHHFAPTIPYSTFIPTVLDVRRPAAPERVRYRTNNLRFNQAYWATIDALEKEGAFATLNIHAEAGVIKVEAENIARLTFDLAAAPEGAGSVEIAGATIAIPAGAKSLMLAKANGAWAITNESIPAGVKKHGLSGPVGDAMMSRFLFVYGDEAGKELARAEADAIRNPALSRRITVADIPHKSSGEVTDADIRDANLFLFGAKETNPLIARLSDKLPIQVDKDGVTASGQRYPGAAAVFIAPNPENPERYVVICSGPLLSALNVFPDLGDRAAIMGVPDYVIFDEDQILKAGVFDGGWEM